MCLEGVGVFLAPPKPLIVDDSRSNPFPPAPQARLGAWPPVRWQDWGWGGSKATSNCPGKTSSLLTSLLSRRRGGRGSRGHTPCQGPIRLLSPPSYPHSPLQPWAKTAIGPKAWWQESLNSQKVTEPSRPEAGSPEAESEAPVRGQCSVRSPLTAHLRALALD